MASRALAVAGRRVAGFPALASSRRGGAQTSHSGCGAHAQAEVRNAGHDSTVTAAQAEAALNSKNVEEVVQEAVDDADAASSWVPDQETGVFVPAEGAASAASVMDQTVFNREEEMEDVERPAVDMANGDNDAK